MMLVSMKHQYDTIAAIASATGAAGLGVVRISGPLAAGMAQTFLGRTPRPRHAHMAHFRSAQGDIIDEGLLLYFPSPASYTGEHVLELHGHGSPALLDMLLHRVCQMGARLARPGEFTERAFLHGKLDLTQAEAVADLIAARSQVAARAAMQSMQGVLSSKVESLLQGLITLRTHIEAAIDFPEEENDLLANSAIMEQLQALCDAHHLLLRETRRGLNLNDGFRVVIVGRPNVGKSSLLNAMAGHDRAIVTAREGTTRDVLRESLNLDGVALELADTAGLRDTDDAIEREGVLRARRELKSADMALLVTEAAKLRADLALFATLPTDVERVILINKSDLDGTLPRVQSDDGAHWLRISAKTGEGMDELRQHLRQRAGAGGGEGVFSARRRHVAALQTVGECLEAALHLLATTRAAELMAEELREAQQCLGEITGRYSNDDLLGAIFSSFCIGK